MPPILPSLRPFFENHPVTKLERGERVVRPRDLVDSVVYVKSGFLKIYSISKLGKELVISYLNASRRDNIMVGLYLAHNAKSYFVEALTSVEIIKVPRGEVLQFLEGHPEVMPSLFRSLYEYITDLYQHIEAMEAGDARTRVASSIYSLAKEFGETEGRQVRVPINITHDMIARSCGVTRETATSQLSWLRWHGIIGIRNKMIVIPDLEPLRDLTEFDESPDGKSPSLF